MSAAELACTYATLILHDDGIAVTAEKIVALVKAANVPCESYWPGLFAKLAANSSIGDLVMNVDTGGASAAVAVSAAGGEAAAPAAEEKKEEPRMRAMTIWDSACLIRFFDTISILLHLCKILSFKLVFILTQWNIVV